LLNIGMFANEAVVPTKIEKAASVKWNSFFCFEIGILYICRL